MENECNITKKVNILKQTEQVELEKEALLTMAAFLSFITPRPLPPPAYLEGEGDLVCRPYRSNRQLQKRERTGKEYGCFLFF